MPFNVFPCLQSQTRKTVSPKDAEHNSLVVSTRKFSIKAKINPSIILQRDCNKKRGLHLESKYAYQFEAQSLQIGEWTACLDMTF